jgi:hypothetical protein
LHRGLLRHLVAIQKSLALLQIMSYGAMNFTPLLNISRSTEQSFLVLFSELLVVIPAVALILVIRCVDLPIFLLLLL